MPHLRGVCRRGLGRRARGAHLRAQSNPERQLKRCWERSEGKPLFNDLGPEEFEAVRGKLLDEAGVIEAFEERFPASSASTTDSRRWYVWDGARWCPDDTQRAFDWSRDLAVKMVGNKVKTLRKVSSGAAVEQGSRALTCFSIASSRTFDRDQWLLGTPGGVVDLRNGELREAKPEENISKLTRVAPDWDMPIPHFIRFLHEAMDDDEEMVEFHQRWWGYNLTGDVSEEVLVYAIGPGGNGKGTLVGAVSYPMGDYACTIATEMLMETRFERHPTEMAALAGARVNYGSETERGRYWNETRLKQLTGGDKVKARFMRCDEFEYNPTGKFTIFGNDAPQLHSVDAAMRRRLIMVPFLKKPARRDNNIKTKKLPAEAPGILAWMIDGTRKWQEDGLKVPAKAREFTDKYLEEQDTLSRGWPSSAFSVRITR